MAAGEACTVRVTGMIDAQGVERSFTANFCNQKGRYARFEETEDREKLERLAGGQFRIRFDGAEETGRTGAERAIFLTREGNAIACKIAGYESGYWYLEAADLPLGEIISVALLHVQGKKGAETLYGDFIVREAELPVFDRTEYKAEGITWRSNSRRILRGGRIFPSPLFPPMENALPGQLWKGRMAMK